MQLHYFIRLIIFAFLTLNTMFPFCPRAFAHVVSTAWLVLLSTFLFFPKRNLYPFLTLNQVLFNKLSQLIACNIIYVYIFVL